MGKSTGIGQPGGTFWGGLSSQTVTSTDGPFTFSQIAVQAQISLDDLIRWNWPSFPALNAAELAQYKTAYANVDPQDGFVLNISDPLAPANFQTPHARDGILAWTAQNNSSDEFDRRKDAQENGRTRRAIETEIARQEAPRAAADTDPYTDLPTTSPIRAEMARQLTLQFAYETMEKAGGDFATPRNLPEGWFDNPEHPEWPQTIGEAMGVIHAAAQAQQKAELSENLGCIMGPIYYHLFSPTNPTSGLNLVTAWGAGKEILPDQPMAIETRLPGGFTLVKTINRVGASNVYTHSYGLKPPGTLFGGTFGLTETQAQGLFDKTISPTTIKAPYATSSAMTYQCVEQHGPYATWSVKDPSGATIAHIMTHAGATPTELDAMARVLSTADQSPTQRMGRAISPPGWARSAEQVFSDATPSPEIHTFTLTTYGVGGTVVELGTITASTQAELSAGLRAMKKECVDNFENWPAILITNGRKSNGRPVTHVTSLDLLDTMAGTLLPNTVPETTGVVGTSGRGMGNIKNIADKSQKEYYLNGEDQADIPPEIRAKMLEYFQLLSEHNITEVAEYCGSDFEKLSFGKYSYSGSDAATHSIRINIHYRLLMTYNPTTHQYENVVIKKVGNH
jgi:hypothetical protein